MEVLVLDGKSYVKASKAARDLGYATDYVGQLCRGGKVDARLIGRTWYVNSDELGTHRLEKKRMSRIKARAQAKRVIEERRLRITEEPKNYVNIDIQYEHDDRELIPETRKVEVISEDTRLVREKPAYDSKTVIENRGNKILMSGDLEVVDVTDAPVETDTVTLTPGRIRSGTITVTPRSTPGAAKVAIHTESEEVAADTDEPIAEARKSFSERLEALESDDSESTAEVSVSEESTPTDGPQTAPEASQKSSLAPYAVLTLVVFSIITLTVPLTQVFEYSADTETLLISYRLSFDNIISYIQHKI